MSVSLNEYLHTKYEPDCDFVDSELVDRNAGYVPHAIFLTEMRCILRGFRPIVRAHPIQRLRTAPTRIRVADIALEAPNQNEPLACIEVLSHLDTLAALREKIDDYLKFGVRYVWVLDPESRRAWEYTADGSREIKDGILRTQDPAVEVNLAEVYAGLES